MIQDTSPIPFIGQFVDFHPTPSERYAAVVVEVHPTEADGRPCVNLVIFTPEGLQQTKEKVPPAAPSGDPELDADNEFCNIANTWSYQQEIILQQVPEHDPAEEWGTQSNAQVGTLRADRFC